jgi:hypothetical protein
MTGSARAGVFQDGTADERGTARKEDPRAGKTTASEHAGTLPELSAARPVAY